MDFSTAVRKMVVQAVIAMLTLAAGESFAQVNFTGPQPGDVYREYTFVPNPSGNTWRVTDPNVDQVRFPSTVYDLPNYTNTIPNVSDLQGAIRAEVVLTVWGGHVGTTNKKISFNGNQWMTIPELGQINGIPAGKNGQCYMTQENITLPLPLEYLVTGNNTYTATTGTQSCFGWGWGMFAIYKVKIRVYYDPATKAHPTGYISSPSNNGLMSDGPTIAATITGGNVDRVDIIGSYYGYDTDGDGIFNGYHYDYHLPTQAFDNADIHNHVGTATGAPWQVTWDTRWVPDQVAGGIKLMARIRDVSGIWYCSPEVVNLSLVRTGTSVQMFTTTPQEECWTQGGVEKWLPVNVPSVQGVTDAGYMIRSYNMPDILANHPQSQYPDWRMFNNWVDDQRYGNNHYYSFDVRPIPLNTLVQGTNNFHFNATVPDEHGIEMLWPGPALMLKYTGGSFNSPVPLASNLVIPANGATDAQTSPILAWNPTPGGNSYQLQVSTDPGFGTTVFDQSNLTDTTQQINNLAPLATYYWRVRATGPAGVGPYSSVFSFTTKLGAPTHVAPPNTASSIPTTATIRWQRVPGATGYQLQVSSDPTFATGLVVDNSSIADTTYQATGLAYSVLYYWHVKANGVVGGFSLPWSFTTIVGPAAIPVLSTPANGTQGLAIASIDFTWQAAQWATTYRLQVSSDPSFASGIAFDDSTISGTMRSVTGLLTDRIYYWRVRGKGIGGIGSYSSPWSFETVRTIPLAASLIYPSNGASALPVVGLTFRWASTAGATHYGFQLTTDSTFTTTTVFIKNDSGLVDSSRLVNGLNTNTRYFWRVRARNSAGWGPYSPSWSMTTVVPLPGRVSLIAPLQGSLATAESATFAWNNPSPAASRYMFEIAFDSLFTSFRSIDTTLTDTVKVYRPLVDGQWYYWHVRGWNAGGWGPFSETRAIRVVISSVGEHPSGVPETFALEQNHPNPFNPSTKIGFSLPRETRVKLDVYNMLGQKVATLLDEHMGPGYYTATFDASTLPSGVFLYRLVTSSGVLVRKMILMK